MPTDFGHPTHFLRLRIFLDHQYRKTTDDQGPCDDDGIFDSQDNDIDGDGVLNADDKQNSCSSNTGIWIVGGLAVAGAAVLISDGDDETISP